jgi:hypothetical protein
MTTRILCLLTTTLALGCADAIGFDDEGLDETTTEDDDTGTGDDTGGEGKVEHEELGGGVRRTTLDASDESAWVYLDLDTGDEAIEGGTGWDLSVRRFDILLAGGTSGDAGVEVAILEGAQFESLAEAPTDAVWITDQDPDLAMFDWYDYDMVTHLLSAKDRVYLIRSSEDAVFKLQIVDYYSSAGSSGFLQFYWAPLG